MPLNPGQVLNNRYRIVRLLGQGGMGAIYRAWDLQLEGACAVKENLDSTPEAQRQFEREAKLLFGLRHPGLPKVFDYFALPGQGQYLVMEYIEGEDLESKIGQAASGFAVPQPISEAEALLWIAQVCDALCYLHSRTPPVIHRDVKPANVKITPEGQVVLVDFGIAKSYNPQLSTTMGAKAVTPGYSPLEQYSGKTDAQSDVYALGATAYTLLTGQAPPPSVDISAGIAPPPLPVHNLNPTVSGRTSQAIAHAMQLNRTERTPSAAVFKAELGLAVGASDSVVGTSTGRMVTAPVVRSAASSGRVARRLPDWLRWAGAALLVVVLVIAAYFVGGGSGKIGAGRATLSSFPTIGPTQVPLTPMPTRPPYTPIPTLKPVTTLTFVPTISPAPTKPPGVITDPSGAQMALVPAGKFEMGLVPQDAIDECVKYGWDCPKSLVNNAEPMHTVYLDEFYIDLYEVTNTLYDQCVAAGACQPLSDTTSSTRASYANNSQYANYPVLYVSWDDATAFCAWREARLPTEAEWEKAARGIDGRIYTWGNQDPTCQLANIRGIKACVGDTSAVGSCPAGASPYGLFDMVGNIWEWVADWYSSSYYASSPASNPSGPPSGQFKVLRGSSFLTERSHLQVAFRRYEVPNIRNASIGFRCAR